MTRNGKIARLPRDIREQLNRRLQDGEQGKELVRWLNELPEVKEVLEADFSGRPIKEQNLSEWKQGGYRDWERHEESCSIVRRLTEETNDLRDEADGVEVSHRLATVLAVELARLTGVWLEETTDPEERWRRLREALRELAQLRQEDRKTGWLLMERERWDEELEQRRDAEEKSAYNREKSKILAPIWAQLRLNSMAEVFGGGENGRAVAAFILEVQKDLPLGSLTGKNLCKPSPEADQTRAGAANEQAAGGTPDQAQANQIKPSQGESNQVKPDQVP